MQGRDHQHQGAADDGQHLDRPEHAGALVIRRRDHRGPGRVGQDHHGQAQIIDRQPAHQPDRVHPSRGIEQHQYAGNQHHEARRQPDPVAAQGRPRPVHGQTQQRVHQHVGESQGHEGQPDGGQAEAEMGGVVMGQIDRDGDRDGADAQAGTRKSQEGRAAQPVGDGPVASEGGRRCIHDVAFPGQDLRGRSPLVVRLSVPIGTRRPAMCKRDLAPVSPPASRARDGSAGSGTGWRRPSAPRRGRTG